MSAQNQDKMKTKLNIALEGTCNRRRCGRFIILDRGSLQALFVFAERGLNIARGIQKERAA